MGNEKTQTFRIGFGFLVPPIDEQLKAAGYKFNEKKVAEFECIRQHITQLRFADIFTDSMYDIVIKRLFNKIQKHVVKENNLKEVKSKK